MKIAIIGSGLSGLTLAKRLQTQHEVVVFEKSHSVGGRMSTRHKDIYSFDHGAQYFSAKSDEFQEFLASYLSNLDMASWAPRLVKIDEKGDKEPIVWDRPRYVGVPYMRALCEAVSKDIDVKLNVEIEDLSHIDGNWQLTDKDGHNLGAFDWIVTATPSTQAKQLLPLECSYMSALEEADMKGCFSLMLGLEEVFDPGWDAALIENGPVSWVSNNSTKPGRPAGTSIVAQSSNDWANAHIEDDRAAVQQEMMQNLEKIVGKPIPAIAYQELHRWRYANVKTSAGQDVLIDQDQQLASCGDWCLSGKIESAFLSAVKLSEILLNKS